MTKYVLECIGTFFLVLLLTSTLIFNERSPSTPRVDLVAAVFGGSIAGLVLILGKYTGAHVNPAVTIAYSIDGVLPWKDTIPYLGSQCIGAFAASALLKSFLPSSANIGTVLLTLDDVPAFIQEFNFSLIFLIGVLAVPRDTPNKRRLSAFVTGSLAAITVYILGPVSGTSMNPARALAPAILSGQTETLWINVTAPIFAAVAAASLHSIYRAMRPVTT